MRSWLVFLLLAAPMAALAADVKPSRGLHFVAQPPKAGPRKTSIAALASRAAQTTAGDPSGCRIACADNYYVCRTATRADDCAPAWSQCVAACELPNLDVAGAVSR
jgi:hypothetical protein